MGFCVPEQGVCERCRVFAMLHAVAEDEAPSHCEDCLDGLCAMFEAYMQEREY